MRTVRVPQSEAQQQHLTLHHHKARPDDSAGALVMDQSCAAPSADSCWLVFLHLLNSFRCGPYTQPQTGVFFCPEEDHLSNLFPITTMQRTKPPKPQW